MPCRACPIPSCTNGSGATEIYRQPASAFVADFIGRASFVPAKVIGHENERLIVSVFGHSLSVPQPKHHLRFNDPAMLVVRPETVQIEGQYHHLTGTVRRAAYLGDQIEYEVEINEQLITVVEYDPRRMTIHPAGSQVAIGFLEDHIYVLPRER